VARPLTRPDDGYSATDGANAGVRLLAGATHLRELGDGPGCAMSPGEGGEHDRARKRPREPGHAHREQAEVEAPRRGARKRLGIAAARVIATCVVIMSAGGCGSNHVAKTGGTQPQATGAEVASLLAGIRQSGNTLGDPRAPVTVQYFADLQCPYCRRFTLGVLPSLIGSYVRSGKLKIEYRSLETATHNPGVFEVQQVAALAAGKQNKLWDFIDLFYHEQAREDSGYVTERYLQGLARQVTGLNLIEWTAARNDPELAHTLAGDARAAASAGLSSTPSFLVTTLSRKPYVSAIEKQLQGPSSAG
jgi:protein-disulfide isomerase